MPLQLPFPSFFTESGGPQPASQLDSNFAAVNTSLTTEQQITAGTTTDLGSVASNNVLINFSGSPTVSNFGSSAITSQPFFNVRWAGTGTATLQNSSSILIAGGANITINPNDQGKAIYLGSGNWSYAPNIGGTAVTPGSYTSANLTVNQFGQVTAASNGSSSGGIAYNSISGCLPSGITGTNTTAALTISAGQAADSTNSVYINSAGYSWAAANGNAINGTDASSSTLSNSTTYHMYLISGTSGIGVFASATYPASSVTFPVGYRASARRIFSFNTNSSGAPTPYTAIEAEGGSTINWLTTQTLDISTTSLASSSRTLFSLNVPTAIKVGVFYRAQMPTLSSENVLLTSGDEVDVAPDANNWTTAPGSDGYGVTGASSSFPRDGLMTTNTSGQIGARALSGTASLYWVTRGFKDFRRL